MFSVNAFILQKCAPWFLGWGACPSPYLDIVTSDIYKHISYLCGNVAMAQSKPCLLWTAVTWSEDQESCIVTQYIGISMTEGNLWLLKQDLLSSVKNDYGSNWNLINEHYSQLICFSPHWMKMQSHPHWSHGRSFATEVNRSKIKFTLLTFFISPK